MSRNTLIAVVVAVIVVFLFCLFIYPTPYKYVSVPKYSYVANKGYQRSGTEVVRINRLTGTKKTIRW